jgi:hypothetical protein
MTYDFDDPAKFEEDYDATAAKRQTQMGGKKDESNDLNRNSSKKSAKSVRSYISNVSEINKSNLSRFGKMKITFLVGNTIVSLKAQHKS